MEGAWSMDRQEIVRELRRLMKCRNNDAVKLAYLETERIEDIDKLDLRGVTEIKRSEKGCFEVRFVDRLKVLEMLERLCAGEDSGLEAFLEGLQDGEGL